MKTRVYGRVSCEKVTDPISGDNRREVNELMDEKTGELARRSVVEQLKIRSVLTCESERGVCAKCYGLNLANRQIVKVGEAVGIIAAQSLVSRARS